MILAIAAPFFLSPTCDRLRAVSDAGQVIEQTLSNVSAHMRRSFTFGEKWNQTMESMLDVLNECSGAGWDGYEAIPVSMETANQATEFIRTIPYDLPIPEISATSAGELTFEWAQSARRIVTVVVGQNGEVHYAMLNGVKKNFGSYPLNGAFEPELMQAIDSVLG